MVELDPKVNLPTSTTTRDREIPSTWQGARRRLETSGWMVEATAMSDTGEEHRATRLLIRWAKYKSTQRFCKF
jgi:hypothetical protein